ncbi:MAG: hypothetical protein AAF456_18715 [Planctomycetota bacterium]
MRCHLFHHNAHAQFIETFDKETANTAETVAAYPHIVFDDPNNEAPGFLVENGILKTPVGNHDNARFPGAIGESFTVSFRLGGSTGSNGLPVGAWFGGTSTSNFIRVLFHPGFGGGHFRAEQDGGTIVNNTDMGFNVAAEVLHDWTVSSDGLGNYVVTVIDGSNPTNVFEISFQGQILASNASFGISTGGRAGIYGDVIIDEYQPPPPRPLFVFDGTHDNNWTNGPDFPGTGTVGANWTINGGAAGQLAVPDSGSISHSIDYDYSGSDWTLEDANISEDVQIVLNDGNLTVRNANLSLQPTSANIAVSLSGMNLGNVGPMNFLIDESNLTFGRSNGTGHCLGIFGGSTGLISNSNLTIDSELGAGDIEVRMGSVVSITNSTIEVEDEFRLLSTGTVVSLLDVDINAAALRTNQGSQFIVDGSGVITLSNSNPLRSNNTYLNDVNIVSNHLNHDLIVCTNPGYNLGHLAAKVAGGYFSIDGVQIEPPISDNADWLSVANQLELNRQLKELEVNGKFFRVVFNLQDQRQQLNEPGPQTIYPAGVTPQSGDFVSGDVEELSESDDLDFVMRRANNDVQSRTQFDLEATSPVALPQSLVVTIEAAVFARGTVVQSIDLFNYDTNSWEQVDSQPASRLGDVVVIIEPDGDLSRFVEPGTNLLEARVRYRSISARRQFASRTDLFHWTIE